MTYADRLAELNDKFQNATPPERKGDFQPLPDGTYQITINKALLAEVKTGKREGSMRVEFHGTVLVGEFKGHRVWKQVNLEMEADGARPSGVSILKGDLMTLGITELPSLARLEDYLKKTIGLNVEVSSRTRNDWTNIYFNSLIGDITLNQKELEPTEDPFAQDNTAMMDTAPEMTTVTKKKRGRPRGSKNKTNGKIEETAPIANQDVEEALETVPPDDLSMAIDKWDDD